MASNKKVLIGYSTMFGTSAGHSEKLEKQLEKNGIDCICNKLDAYGDDWIMNYQGDLLLLLSTTGNGDCPSNAIKFYESLKTCINNKKRLQNLRFSILGFGSTVYPKFCGFAVEIHSLLTKLGAKQITQLRMCDSNLKVYQNGHKVKSPKDIFSEWQKQLIQKLSLKQKRENKQKEGQVVLPSQIQKLFEIKKLKKLDKTLAAEITINNAIEDYDKIASSRVIQISQLREMIEPGSNRSTLHVKIQKSPSIKLTPACNIYIYPENVFRNQKTFQNIQSQPLLIRQILKRAKLNQIATREMINIVFNEEQNFLHMSRQEKLAKYKQCIMNKNLTLQNLIEEYIPKDIRFYSKLQLEPPRPYTLCSWHENQEFIELCVSTVPNGVTSKYLKSNPESLKITASCSSFEVPLHNEPIIMICNGSGIAPFRSIAQFYTQKRVQFSEPPLKLFYGIQNQNIDFYFKQEWNQYQKKGIVDVKIAESRRNPEDKEYVQDIIDPNEIYDHLFKKRGLIYICGASGMASDVQKIIRKALEMEYKNEHSIGKELQALKQKGKIIEQIFH